MNRSAEVPLSDALLCEACGYNLTGVPRDGLCPECGQAIAESLPSLRRPPVWETAERPGYRQWLATSSAVILHTNRFFRQLAPRGDMERAARFARWHELLVCALFGLCLTLQLRWMLILPSRYSLTNSAASVVAAVAMVPLIFACVVVLRLATRLAVRLTQWEARYRGLRLPLPVVQRAMHYHAAHYVPVAIVATLTVAGYHLAVALDVLSELQGPRFLYVLSAEVLLGAAYLFETYWIAMRKLMWAN
ncbi:MAG: hypothetical protein ABSH20_16430 [Tepidisphaeraceae bacterium]|jgi:hypothetical protein